MWFFFPIVLLCELFFGFNGHLVMVGNMPIRTILFIFAFISLCGCSIWVFIKSKTTLPRLLSAITYVDISIFIFLLATFVVWVIIVPIAMGGSLSLAISESHCMLILVLFFPLSFLMRAGAISMADINSTVKWLCIALGFIHIAFFIAESISPLSTERFFDIIAAFGEAPKVILGHNFVRVIYPTSLLLLTGIYLFFKNFDNLKPSHYICLISSVGGLLTTVTKGLLLAALGMGIAFCIGYTVHKLRLGKKHDVFRLAKSMAAIILCVLICDMLVFSGRIGSGISNPFTTSVNAASISAPSDEGTNISNSARLDQIASLMKKWGKSPVVGHGYGSFAPDCIRSTQSPYSYEMTSFALLMKVGILGILPWIALFAAFISCAFRRMKRKYAVGLIAWCALSIGFLVGVQTNPFLFNFPGISMLLYIALASQGDATTAI